eukprot:gnl/TRDRNA2_/TRDRNA2_31644_c0_seq1.p1 gnl/TRDRNA2_/TRDRNA2_31644_c0~~gnl/TRDRNA2_/TRDRNA2_31644_c0_seq1.p1  ORF type:complete len:301 (-),score=39.50 gnl/TRDRNA2_/TRDRNA2_31644_c0_seq1:62-964(-)
MWLVDSDNGLLHHRAFDLLIRLFPVTSRAVHRLSLPESFVLLWLDSTGRFPRWGDPVLHHAIGAARYMDRDSGTLTPPDQDAMSMPSPIGAPTGTVLYKPPRSMQVDASLIAGEELTSRLVDNLVTNGMLEIVDSGSSVPGATGQCSSGVCGRLSRSLLAMASCRLPSCALGLVPGGPGPFRLTSPGSSLAAQLRSQLVAVLEASVDEEEGREAARAPQSQSMHRVETDECTELLDNLAGARALFMLCHFADEYGGGCVGDGVLLPHVFPSSKALIQAKHHAKVMFRKALHQSKEKDHSV